MGRCVKINHSWLNKNKKVIDFHNAIIAFEKILKYYVRSRKRSTDSSNIRES